MDILRKSNADRPGEDQAFDTSNLSRLSEEPLAMLSVVSIDPVSDKFEFRWLCRQIHLEM